MALITARVRSRLLLIAIALDVLIMTTFFMGKRNETISACLYSLDKDQKWWGRALRVGVDYIFELLGDPDHCHQSWKTENPL